MRATVAGSAAVQWSPLGLIQLTHYAIRESGNHMVEASYDAADDEEALSKLLDLVPVYVMIHLEHSKHEVAHQPDPSCLHHACTPHHCASPPPLLLLKLWCRTPFCSQHCGRTSQKWATSLMVRARGELLAGADA